METIVRLVQEGYIVRFEPHPFYPNALVIILSKNQKHISHALLLDNHECLLSIPAQMIYIFEYLERTFKYDKTGSC